MEYTETPPSTAETVTEPTPEVQETGPVVIELETEPQAPPSSSQTDPEPAMVIEPVEEAAEAPPMPPEPEEPTAEPEVEQPKTFQPEFRKDLYGDLQKVEDRGKRLKHGTPPPEPPRPEPVPEPITEPVSEPEPTPEPSEPELAVEPAPEGEPITKPQWEPLSGRKLRKAEEVLTEYKRWLNKGFKAGMLTREQCAMLTRHKEIEMGILPPE